MKRILLFGITIFFIQSAFAQSFRKTTFTAPLKGTAAFADPTIKNYNPSLLNVDQHPVQYSDYGDKKKLVQERRKLKGTPITSSNKTLGVAQNPVISQGWEANPGTGVPMDNDIAVSNGGWVVSAVNSNIFVYDTAGVFAFARNVNDMDSVLGLINRISDPRLLYDPNADRFILVCFSGNTSVNSTLVIGFSTTNNPADNWNFYTLTGNPFNDSTWSDYPIISISDKDLFMTFNQIQEGVSWQTGFRQSVIYQIKKSDGFTAMPLQYTLWDSLKFNGKLYRNICPAKYQETTMGDDMYFLSVRNVDLSNDSVFILHIDASHQSAVATISHRVIQSPISYGFPPNPPMKNGNELATNDGRVLAAIYENDYIHFGTNSVNPAFNNAGVYLGEIQNVSSANPTIKATIFSDAATEYGYPSMTYMGSAPTDHRVLFMLDHCYTDSFPGVTTLYKNPNGDFSDMIRVKNGTGSFNYLSSIEERWGDYSGIQKMYNNPNVAYLAGTYARFSTYRAWVAKITNADWPVSVAEQANSKEAGAVFPNPIEQSKFTVRFSLVKNEHLTFNLYDATGRLVKTLFQQDCKTGRNEFSFNTGVLATGNYVFTIVGEKDKILSEIITVK